MFGDPTRRTEDRGTALVHAAFNEDGEAVILCDPHQSIDECDDEGSGPGAPPYIEFYGESTVSVGFTSAWFSSSTNATEVADELFVKGESFVNFSLVMQQQDFVENGTVAAVGRERPRIVVGPDGTVVVAFSIFPQDREVRALFDDARVIVRERGIWDEVENVTRTGNEVDVRDPRPAVDREGRIHLLWTESSRELDDRPGEVLHSIRGADGWASPDTVFRNSRGSVPQLPWALPSDQMGRIHAAFEREPVPDHLPLVTHWIWSPEEGWSDRFLSERRSAIQPDLVLGSGGEFLLTFIDSDGSPEFGPDRNSIFFARSDDLGATWVGPHRIAPRTGRATAAQRPRVAAALDGRTHVVVQVSGEGTIEPEALEHLHSADGECWFLPERIDMPTPGVPGQPEIWTDGGGGLHLVFFLPVRGRGVSGSSYVRYAWWNGRTWSEPERLFDFSLVRNVASHQDETGTVHLLMAVDDGHPRRLFYTTGRPTGQVQAGVDAREPKGEAFP